LPKVPHEEPVSQRARDLSHIVDMLSRTPSVRSELVADIRGQFNGGAYMSEEKLDLAIYRMLKDILE
jgi:hypothetical protein